MQHIVRERVKRNLLGMLECMWLVVGGGRSSPHGAPLMAPPAAHAPQLQPHKARLGSYSTVMRCKAASTNAWDGTCHVIYS